MTRRALGCSFLYAAALSVSVAAQSPQQTPPPQTSAPQTPTSAPAATVTPAVSVEGCLFQEADVPGRRPPEEQRAQVKADDDYVLAMAKVIKGSSPAPGTSRPDATPTGTSGVTAAVQMYEIEGLEKAQLREYAGRRVQIDGTFENLDRAKNPVSFATDLVELRGTSIRPVAGDCSNK